MTGIDWPRAGIHDDLPADAYHADPCKAPSLTASIAKVLVGRSPKHAWTAHPRLNPEFKREEKATFDLGSAAHAMLLQGEKFAELVAVADFDDWRTKAAQEHRKAARAAGMVPLLAKDWARTLEMAAAVSEQIAERDIDPPLLTDGKPEQTLVWQEQGITLRARLDWLRDDFRAVDDYKSTGATADPRAWGRRTFWDIGCDIQAAFYCRGVHALVGKWPAFRFIVAETVPPFAISVLSPGRSAFALGQQKVDYAIAKWKRCLADNHWPAYPLAIAEVDQDGWQEANFLTLVYGEDQEAAA